MTMTPEEDAPVSHRGARRQGGGAAGRGRGRRGAQRRRRGATAGRGGMAGKHRRTAATTRRPPLEGAGVLSQTYPGVSRYNAFRTYPVS